MNRVYLSSSSGREYYLIYRGSVQMEVLLFLVRSSNTSNYLGTFFGQKTLVFRRNPFIFLKINVPFVRTTKAK